MLLRSDGQPVLVGKNDELQCDFVMPDMPVWTYKCVSAGLTHSALLPVHGFAVVQLGEQHEFYDNPDLNTIRLPELSPEETYVAVACGDGHTACLTVEGRVVFGGSDQFGQSTIPTPFDLEEFHFVQWQPPLVVFQVSLEADMTAVCINLSGNVNHTWLVEDLTASVLQTVELMCGANMAGIRICVIRTGSTDLIKEAYTWTPLLKDDLDD